MNTLTPLNKERVVYSGKHFKIIHQDMKFGDKTLIFEIARRSPGVRVIITKDNKILLTKEYRAELEDFDYRLPGGKVFDSLDEYQEAIDSKKDIAEYTFKAAKKEALEETGTPVKDMTLFCTTKAGGTIEWDLFYFIVSDFHANFEDQKLEDGEIISVEWKTFQEVKNMCVSGVVKEDRSVGVLLRYLNSYKSY
jgi:8-oxo-dGTP pyrophosphatase MutT (NUDIX family)